MKPRRWLELGLFASAGAGALLACTLTQSLDYLQKGGEDGGTSVVPEGGGDAADAPASKTTVLVPNQTKPGLLAQDAAALYWTADGKVLSVPKTGGMPKVLGPAPLAANLLVADPDPGGFVFMATGNDVIRLPKDGSGGGVVFAAGATSPPTGAIAADEALLFVLQYDVEESITGKRIVRMAKDGGGQVDFAPDGGPTTLNLDPTSVVWLDSVAAPSFHVQDKSAPGPTSATLAAGPFENTPASPADVALDATGVYWTAYEGGSGAAVIYKRDRQPGGMVVAIGRGGADDTFTNIAMDDTHVYVLSSSSLVRAPKSGTGDAVRVLAGLEEPSGLVVDATAIYMTVEATGSTGAVIKVAK